MQSVISLNLKKSFYFFLSLREGGILQILQSGWYRERAVFHDLARRPGRNRWQLHSQVCLLFVNEQNPCFVNHLSFKTCAVISISQEKVNFVSQTKSLKEESSNSPTHLRNTPKVKQNRRLVMSLHQIYNLCCKYCDLAFMHCLFDISALFVVLFSLFAV